jgi:solute carrier family 13 (sodium-dependent dicarboxylate transporter), member 2/3/5
LSGLTQLIAEQLVLLKNVNIFLLVLIINFLIVTITGVANNITVVQVFLPILASLSKAIDVHPLILMVPGTISSSFAFLLPISTPPNMVFNL